MKFIKTLALATAFAAAVSVHAQGYVVDHRTPLIPQLATAATGSPASPQKNVMLHRWSGRLRRPLAFQEFGRIRNHSTPTCKPFEEYAG